MRALFQTLTLILLLLATGAGARSEANTTLVFGTASDPVVLDGPLVSDGESLRPIHRVPHQPPVKPSSASRTTLLVRHFRRCASRSYSRRQRSHP